MPDSLYEKPAVLRKLTSASTPSALHNRIAACEPYHIRVVTESLGIER